MDPTGGAENAENGEPRILSSAPNTGWFPDIYGFLADYGWFLLIGIAVAVFVWQKYMAEQWRTISALGQDQISVVKKNDDANAIMARHEAMLAARQRMQEEQHRLSAIAKEEMAKREEEKRRLQIEEWERHKKGGGYHSKSHVAEEKPSPSGTKLNKSQAKKPLRPNDYNPLSGSGGGSNYRPSRRFGGGGGGG